MADLAFVLLTLVFFSGLAFIVVRIERAERAGARRPGEVRGASDTLPASSDPEAARK